MQCGVQTAAKGCGPSQTIEGLDFAGDYAGLSDPDLSRDNRMALSTVEVLTALAPRAPENLSADLFGGTRRYVGSGKLMRCTRS